LKIHKLDAYDDETLERLLRRFGEYLNRGLRGSDIACRYADNNFWILLPNTPPEGVEALKTRLLENMKKEFSEEFTGFNLETSIGLLESEESEEAFVRRISQKKEG
ncbi:diguanylate cyclase, partial [Nitratifractor sp.]|uniref:diguanylate cyclase domain-containing protein n=1 Tax=Nitratifractor sp. TaxID=2268144 RepID=UPI0025E2FD70